MGAVSYMIPVVRRVARFVVVLIVLACAADDGSNGSGSGASSSSAGTTSANESSGSGSTTRGSSTAESDSDQTGSPTSAGSDEGGNGDPCDDETECMDGSSCVPGADGGSVCAASCVPFDGIEDCGNGWFCLSLMENEGRCYPPTDSGAAYDEDCAPAGNACAEDLVCNAFAPGSVFCVALCRLSQGDADCPDTYSCLPVFMEMSDEVGSCAPIGA